MVAGLLVRENPFSLARPTFISRRIGVSRLSFTKRISATMLAAAKANGAYVIAGLWARAPITPSKLWTRIMTSAIAIIPARERAAMQQRAAISWATVREAA